MTNNTSWKETTSAFRVAADTTPPHQPTIHSNIVCTASTVFAPEKKTIVIDRTTTRHKELFPLQAKTQEPVVTSSAKASAPAKKTHLNANARVFTPTTISQAKTTPVVAQTSSQTTTSTPQVLVRPPIAHVRESTERKVYAVAQPLVARNSVMPHQVLVPPTTNKTIPVARKQPTKSTYHQNRTAPRPAQAPLLPIAMQPTIQIVNPFDPQVAWYNFVLVQSLFAQSNPQNRY